MDVRAVSKGIFTSRWFISGAVAVYGLLGFFLLPFLAGHYLKRYVHDQLNHEPMLQDLHFNPFTLTLEAKAFGIKPENQAPLVILGFVSVNFDLLSSVYHRAWAFSGIRLIDPQVRLVVTKDGQSNLIALVKDLKGPGGEKAAGNDNQALPRMLFEQVTLRIWRR